MPITFSRLAPDHALLDAYLRDGNEDTFRALMARYLPMVESISMRVVGDRQLAQEVAQNTFTLLARKARTFSNEITISSWLFKTARYEALRLHRNETTRQRKMADFARATNAKEADPPAEQALHILLDEALARMAEGDRQTLLLRYVDGLSIREIAGWLGKSEAAAQKRLERLIQKLRERLLKQQGHTVTGTTITAALSTQFTPTAQALSCAQLAPDCLAQAANISPFGKLSAMTIKAFSPLTITALIGFGSLIAWQVHDLRATSIQIGTLQQAMAVVPEQATIARPLLPQEVAAASTEPAPQELPPIIVPPTPEDGMRQWVEHKMKEADWHKRYNNRVLPPDTREREEFERQRSLWVASTSSLMLSQMLIMKSFEDEDTAQMAGLFVVGYKLALGPSEPELKTLTTLTSLALKAKKESRKIHPQGTPESQEAVSAIETDLIAGVLDTMGESGKERFLEVFGHHPLSSMSLGFPIVYDSEAERDAGMKKFGFQPKAP